MILTEKDEQIDQWWEERKLRRPSVNEGCTRVKDLQDEREPPFVFEQLFELIQDARSKGQVLSLHSDCDEQELKRYLDDLCFLLTS
jgi:hypothetical protein